MKTCTDKEKELIELIKGQPQIPSFMVGKSKSIVELMNDIRVGRDQELIRCK